MRNAEHRLARFPNFSLGGRERSILQGVLDHLATVRECVLAYQELVTACSVEAPSTQELLERVFELEDKADEIQRDLNQRIAEGAFFGGVREDILNLINEDDSIADAAKDASRLLVMGQEGGPSLASVLTSEHMARFEQNLLAAVDALSGIIAALQVDKKSVLARVHTVEDYEEAADTEKDYLLREIFSMRKTMDAVSIIQLRDFLFASDDIADNAENAGDVIVVLVAKGYG